MTLLRATAQGFVGGLVLYGVCDVLGEMTTFLILREKGVALANDSSELQEQIGHPFTTGPWYNSSIGFAAGQNMVQCTFQLKGSKQITDISVKGMRQPGVSNRFFYNLLGPGQWGVVDCTAMFPIGGGQVAPRSLLTASRFHGPPKQELGIHEVAESKGETQMKSGLSRDGMSDTSSRKSDGSTGSGPHGTGSSTSQAPMQAGAVSEKSEGERGLAESQTSAGKPKGGWASRYLAWVPGSKRGGAD